MLTILERQAAKEEVSAGEVEVTVVGKMNVKIEDDSVEEEAVVGKMGVKVETSVKGGPIWDGT